VSLRRALRGLPAHVRKEVDGLKVELVKIRPSCVRVGKLAKGGGILCRPLAFPRAWEKVAPCFGLLVEFIVLPARVGKGGIV